MHLCSAKKLIKAASATNILRRPEIVALMDWIYYHEVSSEFTLRHWRIPREIGLVCEEGPLANGSSSRDSVVRNHLTIVERTPFAHLSQTLQTAVLPAPAHALSLVCMACRRSSPDDKYGRGRLTVNHVMEMETLERRIYEVIGEAGPAYNAEEAGLDRRGLIACLYQIAALIYANRTVLKVSKTSYQHRRLVREGMLLLRMLGSCESAWPLFILSCEANTDAQRIEVLEILSRTACEQKRRSNHAHMVQAMAMAVWNQNDLNVDNDVDYCSTLDAVISAAPFMPLLT